MRQVTTRELMTMKAEKRKELMKSQFVIGERVSGKNGKFYPLGVYFPYSTDFNDNKFAYGCDISKLLRCGSGEGGKGFAYGEGGQGFEHD